MAIYHLSAQVISRSQGRSSVAAAAYRAAEQLHDKRLDKTYNFTKKNDVLEKEIFLPQGAPEELKDRETLWNKVEQKERRKDAQVAREINIALPRELSQEQNWKLACDFIKDEFVSKGMIADVAFHAGNGSSKEELNQETQPHIHVMLTMREVTSKGFGQKVRDWNNKEQLLTWRENWANACNLELSRQGFDVRIDHRSLDAQEINLEPQTKIGPKAAYPRMVRFTEHQELAHRNGERIKADPELVLHAITRQQSTFTHHDIARFINRHTKDAEQFTEVYNKVLASKEIVSLGIDDRNIERYTTQTMFTLEKEMLENARKLNTKEKHSLDHIIIPSELNEEQMQALSHITLGKDLSCIVGYAGTGKSYTLGFAREAWESNGYKVTGATLSGIAAENLESGSGIKSFTVANRLWYWERGKDKLTNKDILIIDEAGMLGSRQMSVLLEEVTKANAKAVLIGDPEQLQAIEAGAAFRATAENVGYISLTDIRRQRETWQKEATKDFAEGNTQEALLAYEKHDNIHTFQTKAEAIANMAETWDEVRSQSPEKSQIMLAYTRDEVKSLNEYARSLCRAHGELGEDYGVKTSRGIRDFATGDRIYFLRNENHNLHVKNGTLGTIQETDGRDFIIKLDYANTKGKDTINFNIQDYRDIEHGYAATIYKAQGITVDRAYVLGSKYFDRHTTYVAMSRHKEGVELYYSRDEFVSFAELGRVLGRERSKDVTLDYTNQQDLGNNKELQTDLISPYSAVLDEQRAHLAEQRLNWRMSKSIICHALNEVSQITNLMTNKIFQEGDFGIYIGRAIVDGVNYRIIEQAEKQAMLLSDKQFGVARLKDLVVIESFRDRNGNEHLRGTNPERQLEHDKELYRKELKQEKIIQKSLELDRGGIEM